MALSSALPPEHCLVVSPSLAVALGINCAAILQRLDFLIDITERKAEDGHCIDGFWWVYNGYPEWKRDHFPWMSESTLKRCFLDLEARKLVVSRQPREAGGDRRKWYRIDYNAWSAFAAELAAEPSDQFDPMGTVQGNPSGQSDPLLSDHFDPMREDALNPSDQIDPMASDQIDPTIGPNWPGVPTEESTEIQDSLFAGTHETEPVDSVPESTGLPYHIAYGLGVTGRPPRFGPAADLARNHPLVKAYMGALPEDVRKPVTAAYLDVAQRLEKAGFTPAQVAGLVAERVAAGRVDYAFAFLEEDLPAYRHVVQHPVQARASPRGRNPSPAASTPSAADELVARLTAEELARLPESPPADYLAGKPQTEREQSWSLVGRKSKARQRAKARLAQQEA